MFRNTHKPLLLLFVMLLLFSTITVHATEDDSVTVTWVIGKTEIVEHYVKGSRVKPYRYHEDNVYYDTWSEDNETLVDFSDYKIYENKVFSYLSTENVKATVSSVNETESKLKYQTISARVKDTTVQVKGYLPNGAELCLKLLDTEQYDKYYSGECTFAVEVTVKSNDEVYDLEDFSNLNVSMYNVGDTGCEREVKQIKNDSAVKLASITSMSQSARFVVD